MIHAILHCILTEMHLTMQQARTLHLHMPMPSGSTLAAVPISLVSPCSKFDAALKCFQSLSMDGMCLAALNILLSTRSDLTSMSQMS